MNIIRPRLNDFHNLPFKQEDADFVIPYIDEDIPFYIDPFLLWKSPSLQDNALHLSIINSFNSLGYKFLKGDSKAVKTLVDSSECNEIGLGTSKVKSGRKIGEKAAIEILELYKEIPKIGENGFVHLEEIQLLVDNFGEDRISDITGNFIKSFLIDYTIDNCEKFSIPINPVKIDCFDVKDHGIKKEETFLPVNPNTQAPILLVPKRWLRKTMYINYTNYCGEYYSPKILKDGERPERIKVLNYNRQNYDIVQTYIKIQERQKADCKNDPLFKQVPVLSVKRKLDTILKLPTGKVNNADKDYENNLCSLLASLLYPHLDFAQEQSRTDSGVSIRDLIFYNNNSNVFLKEVYEKYDCRQMVFELKNVKEVDNDHIDQLNRYLKDSFGKFGIIFTRNAPPKKVLKNVIDLWSGQRKSKTNPLTLLRSKLLIKN